MSSITLPRPATAQCFIFLIQLLGFFLCDRPLTIISNTAWRYSLQISPYLDVAGAGVTLADWSNINMSGKEIYAWLQAACCYSISTLVFNCVH